MDNHTKESITNFMKGLHKKIINSSKLLVKEQENTKRYNEELLFASLKSISFLWHSIAMCFFDEKHSQEEKEEYLNLLNQTQFQLNEEFMQRDKEEPMYIRN